MIYEKVNSDMNFVDREKKVGEFWKENKIFEKSIESRREGTPYVFYDGPHYFGTWYYNEERHDIRFSFSEYQIWQAKRQAEGWFDQK